MAQRRMVMRAEIGDAEGDERAVTVTASTQTLGRDDIVLVSAGIELDRYRTNPVWLWQHNPDWPVARAAQIDVVDDQLIARVVFPPAGVSHRADELLGLIRAGIINAASTGFETLEAEPLDPAKPKDGIRILRCELQEVSFVSIPAVPDALISERAATDKKDLQRMVDETVERRERVAVIKRAMVARGLYEVGELAYLLQQLGWMKSCADWEADVEADGSPIPGRLGGAMKELGQILVDMTAEEVAELTGGIDIEVVDADPVEAEIVMQSASPALARFRLGVHRARKAATRAVASPAPSPATPGAKVLRHTSFHRRMAGMIERELTTAA